MGNKGNKNNINNIKELEYISYPTHKYLSIFVFFITESVYYSTLYKTIAGGDSGELVAEACELGIAHPPGYPTYVIINHYFMKYFPWGSPGWKANLLSSICESGAVTLFYLCLDLWTSHTKYYFPLINFICSFLFAFSPDIWLYATSAEVFSLNNLFVGLILYLTFRVTYYGKKRDVLLGAFVCGFALTNQQTIVLYEIPLILYILYLIRENITLNLLLEIGIYFLLGLSPYLFLYFNAIFNPKSFTWGDLSTIQGFINHLLRKDYGTFRLFSSTEESESCLTRTYLLLQSFKDKAYISGFCFGLIGLFFAIKKSFSPMKSFEELNYEIKKKEDKKFIFDKNNEENNKWKVDNGSLIIGKVIIFTLLFYIFTFHSLSNLPLKQTLLYGVHERFWMQPYFIMFMLTSIGLSIIASLPLNIQIISSFSHLYTVLLFGVIGYKYGVNQYWRYLPVSNMSSNSYITNYGKALLSGLPNNSLVLATYDHQWTSLRYLQLCENYRTDLTIVHAPMLTYSWIIKEKKYHKFNFPKGKIHMTNNEEITVYDNTLFSFHDFVTANYRKFKGEIYIGGRPSYKGKKFDETYTYFPHSMMKKIVKKSELSNNPKNYFEKVMYNWEKPDGPKEQMRIHPLEKAYDDKTWEWVTVRDYWDQVAFFASCVLDDAINLNDTVHMNQAARILNEWYDNEVEQYRSFSFLKNTGLALINIAKAKGPTVLPKMKGYRKNGYFVPENGILTTENYISTIEGNHPLYKLVSKAIMIWTEACLKPEAKDDQGYQNMLTTINVLKKAISKEKQSENNAL